MESVTTDIQQFHRTKYSAQSVIQKGLTHPLISIRKLNDLSFYNFVRCFWDIVSTDSFKPNWHIEHVFCPEAERIAYNVAAKKPKEYDLIVNVPPGTTKTIIWSIMFPAWCWTKWHWMRFITGGYSATLSLEAAEKSRDLIRSERFKAIYPELDIKQDKDTKSNFQVVKKDYVNPGHAPRLNLGGNRFSTSVGGTLVGFHGHINIIDDPLNPYEAVSEVELNNANRWMGESLSTRKTDKKVTVTILVMQRVHQKDPSGHWLDKKKTNVRHICLPGQIADYEEQLNPKELKKYYIDGLLDPVRMDWDVLKDMEADLGQYGFAGQVGQKPTPPGGGMFKVAHFQNLESMSSMVNVVNIIRYWDKAGTDVKEIKKGGKACFTAGVKMCIMQSGRFVVLDVKRGQWATEERERIIRETAEADGQNVLVYHEQEPGSGGKDSAVATTRNLAGFNAQPDRPTGDKIYRADPLSVQVNEGNVSLLKGDWNYEYVKEFEDFPFSTYKDQVDASSGAFSKLCGKRQAGVR